MVAHSKCQPYNYSYKSPRLHLSIFTPQASDMNVEKKSFDGVWRTFAVFASHKTLNNLLTVDLRQQRRVLKDWERPTSITCCQAKDSK
jgi:hypothetical protein